MKNPCKILNVWYIQILRKKLFYPKTESHPVTSTSRSLVDNCYPSIPYFILALTGTLAIVLYFTTCAAGLPKHVSRQWYFKLIMLTDMESAVAASKRQNAMGMSVFLISSPLFICKRSCTQRTQAKPAFKGAHYLGAVQNYTIVLRWTDMRA